MCIGSEVPVRIEVQFPAKWKFVSASEHLLGWLDRLDFL